MKLGWSLAQGENRLWAQVLLGKYGPGNKVQEHVVASSTDSTLWKHIVQLWPSLYKHRTWAIGDGKSISFWNDKLWNANQALSEIVNIIPQEIIIGNLMKW